MKQFIQREFLILTVWAKLLLRDRKKYLVVASSTYFIGTSGICKAAKPAYFFCRIIDDCVDGDLEPMSFGYQNNEELLERLKHVLLNPESATKPVEFLLLDLKRKAPPQCETNIVEFLNAMYFEYKRRKGIKVFGESELLELHLKSFLPVLEIAFLSLETDYSMELLAELAIIQSLVYSIQDLDSDLKNGIINLPKELMDTLNIPLVDFQNEPLILWKEGNFLIWVNDCLKQAKLKGLGILETKFSPKASKLISTLVKPILIDIEVLLIFLESKKMTVEKALK